MRWTQRMHTVEGYRLERLLELTLEYPMFTLPRLVVTARGQRPHPLAESGGGACERDTSCCSCRRVRVHD